MAGKEGAGRRPAGRLRSTGPPDAPGSGASGLPPSPAPATALEMLLEELEEDRRYRVNSRDTSIAFVEQGGRDGLSRAWRVWSISAPGTIRRSGPDSSGGAFAGRTWIGACSAGMKAMIGKSSGWALAAVLGQFLWCGAVAAGDDESTVLEQYRRAHVLPEAEVAAVAPEVREAHLAALAVYDEAVASKDPKHPGFKRAREAWEPLVAGGDPASTYQLGMLRLFGLGGAPFDQLAAAVMIKKAAEHRHPPAQTFMGLLAEEGDGSVVTADDKLALDWYTHGALGGHCAAVRRLVRAYEQAELGVAADDEKAGEWRGRLDGCRKR